ncbi:hypothetical protein AB6A40_006047 [Gnathostoma spinigerum]|uniref:Protein kinase domain-containing protein n=1 Tax=Gnathostoma spinigerum TaxID=75299 RepID=A0ABD6EHF4_9BILA
MGYGDLFTLWSDYGPFNEELIRIYASEITYALGYIHSCGIAYRDMKLENVLLDLYGHIQIADFGFAKELNENQRTKTICGTLQYMAPEVARGEPYGKEVDWWALGILLYILYTNRYPFPNAGVQKHSDLRFDNYTRPSWGRSLDDFLDRLLVVEKSNRMCTFEEVHQHSFFSSVKWQDVPARYQDPFVYINRTNQHSHRSNRSPHSDVDRLETLDEDWSAFDEQYEFGDGEYFDEPMPTLP